MNYKQIFPFVMLGALTVTACDDEKMEWVERDPSTEITVAEIPLSISEKISRYDALKTYLKDPNFKLGVGIGMDLYGMDIDSAYTAIVNENFNAVTVGYAMKHAPMVKSDGSLKFDAVDKFVASLPADMDLYGHTLCWHQNQNASYLNGLIAPEVIPGPAGSNLLDDGGFEQGMEGWGSWGSKETVELTTDEHVEGTQAMKVVVNSSSNAVYAVQVESPAIPLIVGHHYQISFFIKSDAAGAARISFDNGLDPIPFGNAWPGNNASDGPDNTISTSATWKQIIYDKDHSSCEFVATGASAQFRIDLGLIPGVTYYIDNVIVIDLDTQGEQVVNLIAGGDFENGTSDKWGAWGNGSMAMSSQGEGFNSVYAIVLTNSTDGASHEAQAGYDWDTPLEMGKTYEFSAMIKASVPASFQIQIQNSTNYSGEGYNSEDVGTDWTEFRKQITVSQENMNRLCLNFGVTAGTYYIDNMVFSPVTIAPQSKAARANTVIEKTDEEKAQIISEALENWIKEMVGHYKNRVHAWDVVNEPMKEDGTLRDGNVSEVASDEFYWVKYMGKDYAVKAFQWARQYGNPDDILFINDYNLEYSLAKCEGLIKYVEYIESQGAQVDGIGTQMHIAINSDKSKIDEMFQKLAQTGKLIKVTELDIKVNTASPSTENFEAQAEMYQYVIDSYMKNIPEAQRYGITIWGVSDREEEHINWIPDDAPNLWDANFARKWAYKGVADGLAGRDVSEDFTGELVD